MAAQSRHLVDGARQTPDISKLRRSLRAAGTRFASGHGNALEMSAAVKISFGPLAAPKGGAFVVFVGADMKPAAAVAGAGRRPRAADPRGREGRQFQGRAAHGARHSRPRRRRGVASDRGRRRAGQGQRAAGFRHARRVRLRQDCRARRRSRSLSKRRRDRGTAPRRPISRLGSGCAATSSTSTRRARRTNDEENGGAPEFVVGSGHAAAARAASHDAVRGRRGRRDRPQPGQRAAERAVSDGIRRSGEGAGEARRRSRHSRREGDGAGSA